MLAQTWGEGGPALPLTYLEAIMEKNDELLTVEEVATFLKIHPRTAWRKISEGTLPAYRLPNSRRVYVRRSDLLSALERVGLEAD